MQEEVNTLVKYMVDNHSKDNPNCSEPIIEYIIPVPDAHTGRYFNLILIYSGGKEISFRERSYETFEHETVDRIYKWLDSFSE